MITPFSVILQEFYSAPLPDAIPGGDPFTLAYNAIWEMLLQNPNFVEMVKPGNRIAYVAAGGRKFNKTFLDEALDADYPEVRILAEGVTPNVINDSCSTKVIRNYSIVVSTNDASLSEHLFPVEWEVLRAMANWRKTLSQLEWEGEKFIKVMRSLAANTGYSLAEADGKVKGWASVWRIELEMYFQTVAMATYE